LSTDPLGREYPGCNKSLSARSVDPEPCTDFLNGAPVYEYSHKLSIATLLDLARARSAPLGFHP
jgi:hypothetical protein